MHTIQHPITGKQIPTCMTGVIVPMFTPANQDSSIDLNGVRSLARYFAESPYIRSCFFRCGMGRMYTYTVDETKECIDVVLEEVQGRKPVFFGTFGEFFDGHFAVVKGTARRPDPQKYLQQSIDLSCYAEKAGATAGVLVVPTAIEAKSPERLQDTIFDYYRAVRESVDMPLIIYNTSGLPEEYRTTPEIIHRICELGGFLGMKLSSDDMRWMTSLEMATEGSNFAMIAGSETSYYHTLHTGGLGVIGQGCDVNPEILCAVFNRFIAGNYPEALQAQFDTNRILKYFDGTDASLAGLAYLQTMGVQVQLHARDGKTVAPPPAQMQAIVEKVNAMCQPYRA